MATSSPETPKKPAAAPATKPAGSGLAIFGNVTVADQLRVLGVVLVLLLVGLGVLIWQQTERAATSTAYLFASGEMRVLSEQTAKDGQLALQGDPAAFTALRAGRDGFNALLAAIIQGGTLQTAGRASTVPASPATFSDRLSALTEIWRKSDQDTQLLLTQETNLTTLGEAVKTINTSNARLLEMTEAVALKREIEQQL